MLEIKHLQKIYEGSTKGIKDLSLTVYPGDICAFIGSNGAGKTTTLKSIVGIHEFDQGEIILNGVSMKEDPLAFKRQIGYSPDSPHLYENLRGYEYLNFIGSVFNIPQDMLEKEVEYLATSLDLKGDLNQLVSTYSHGMKQRLALISIFLHDPKLIILDEPFVGLDPNASYFLIQELKKRAAQGSMVIYSTHVLEIAEKICNRVVLINKGEVRVNGEMKEVVENESLNDLFRRLTAHE